MENLGNTIKKLSKLGNIVIIVKKLGKTEENRQKSDKDVYVTRIGRYE